MKRTAALLTATVAALSLTLAGPAGAAGTGEVEVVPADGGSAFHLSPSQDSISFELVNLADSPRPARIYAASATRSDGGGIGVGALGSAPWLQLPETQVMLAPKQTRTFTAPLDTALLPVGREQLGAVVLEAVQGSVTVRVATLVTVPGRTPSAVPLPTLVVGVAVVLLAVVGLLLLVARRRRRDDNAAGPAPLSGTGPAGAYAVN